ncbi:mutator type transposase, partial [Tanacetum coccineum]
IHNAAKIFKLIEKAAAKLKSVVLGVSSCRKWELSGIPCTHAVAAIWDMASNGTDTGIPESYCNPCHWLSTWKKMYMFKINPINGPQAWKKSDVPTTIILPKPHPQIGRPLKKRKKSSAELADEIMKLVTIKEDAKVKKVEMLVLGAGSQGVGDAGVGG